MTLEGEYYTSDVVKPKADALVAILMTLEGEYYPKSPKGLVSVLYSRNPHDIGRRILQRPQKSA